MPASRQNGPRRPSARHRASAHSHCRAETARPHPDITQPPVAPALARCAPYRTHPAQHWPWLFSDRIRRHARAPGRPVKGQHMARYLGKLATAGVRGDMGRMARAASWGLSGARVLSPDQTVRVGEDGHRVVIGSPPNHDASYQNQCASAHRICDPPLIDICKQDTGRPCHVPKDNPAAGYHDFLSG